jgi:hypothetical protein
MSSSHLTALGHRPPRPVLWQAQVAVATSAPNSHPEVVGVLCGLATLGYGGIAAALGVVRDLTGLDSQELAMQLGLPCVALPLWEQGSFIPRTHHLLRLATVLATHQHHRPAPHQP